MMKDVFIEGERIYLRLAGAKDAKSDWYAWFNDPQVTKYQNKGVFPNTQKKQRDYIKKILKSESDIVLAIIEKRSKKHIGCVGLHNIDWVHRSADLGIVIGRKEVWGKGYGKLAWNMAAYYGFHTLNLHRIAAVILKDNIASIKSAQASGFKIEGQLRDYLFKNGAYRTAIALSALKDDFKLFFNK
ncbi:MAG: GNAT family protein [Candidatus Omnitrophica bacterium]|nr:GNAT family protein [Candidatus Omnitrophota bacterium]